MFFSFDKRDTVLFAKDNHANVCRREMHGASEAIRFSEKIRKRNGLIKLLSGAIFYLATFDLASHIKVLK